MKTINNPIVHTAAPGRIEFVSSYIEDGELNILLQEKSHDASREMRWHLTADPHTRKLHDVHFFISTDEGFSYPEFEVPPALRACLHCFALSVASVYKPREGQR